MARRVSLPAADDLFRPTGRTEEAAGTSGVAGAEDSTTEPAGQTPARSRRTSGRVRHDEKMTVYVTSAELLELEQARLRLRAELGLTADRGRIVREAVALVLADLEEHGEASALARRLRGEHSAAVGGDDPA